MQELRLKKTLLKSDRTPVTSARESNSEWTRIEGHSVEGHNLIEQLRMNMSQVEEMTAKLGFVLREVKSIVVKPSFDF